MKLQVFSIFDVKANIYSPPFFMGQTGEAVRAFKELANNRETTIGRHPEDYVLKRLGFWDNENGVYENENITSLGVASEYVNLGNVTPLGVKRADNG